MHGKLAVSHILERHLNCVSNFSVYHRAQYPQMFLSLAPLLLFIKLSVGVLTVNNFQILPAYSLGSIHGECFCFTETNETSQSKLNQTFAK